MLRRALGLLVLLASSRAAAWPFLAPRPGGTPFEGPTDPELSALFWNPAALAEMRHLHAGLVGQLVIEQGSVARDPICADTGLPGTCASGAARSFPSVPISGASLTGFGGVGYDFHQENVTIAFAVYTPWQSSRSLPEGALTGGSTTSPTAYHLRSESFTTVYYSLGLGVQLTSKLALGAALSLADSWAHVRFDRDAALDAGSAGVARSGFESPASAQHLDLRGDGGHFWRVVPSPSGMALNLGGQVRPTEKVWLGLSWQRMFPLFRGGSGYGSASAEGATVTGPAPCDVSACRGGVSIDDDVPDVWQIGARVALTSELELSTWARVVVWGGYHHDVEGLRLRLSGGVTARGGLPEKIVLDHGLTPTFTGELGLRWRVRPWLRLGASVIGETAAVPGGLVDAEALDGPKLDAMLAAELRLRWVRLTLGYELTGLFLLGFNSPHPGGDDPGATVRCVDARYDLDACQAALEGRGVPSNAGTYHLLVHRVTLGLGVDLDI